MSSASLLEPPPSAERLEPIGTENPAHFTDEKTDLPNGHILQKEDGGFKGAQSGGGKIFQRHSLGKGVDIHYDSGMTTIRIAGTPVVKRREFFENKGSMQNSAKNDDKTGMRLKDNVPNSIKSSMISQSEQPVPTFANQEQDMNIAVPTASMSTIPIDSQNGNAKREPMVSDLNGNSINGNYNNMNQQQPQNNSPKRKKVSFHDAVIINNDEVTTLSDNKNTAQKYVEEVEVTYTNGSTSDLTSSQKDLVFMNGGVTPIVDELELRQLSQKLSSKEKQGPFLPSPPEMTSSVALQSNQAAEPAVKNNNNNKTNKETGNKSKKDKNKSDKSGNTGHGGQRCMWMAVSLLVLAIGGLLVLGILYAIR